MKEVKIIEIKGKINRKIFKVKVKIGSMIKEGVGIKIEKKKKVKIE